MTTREQLEAEAAELYNKRRMTVGSVTDQLKTAHVRAKHVSAEQVEAAAKGAYYATGTPLTWETSSKPQRQTYRSIARAAFRAAGFYVEAADE